MIQEQTILNVADSPGARRAMCIKIPDGSYRHHAGVGGIVKITIREAIPHDKVKKGDMLGVIVVRTEKDVRRPDGSVIRFNGNARVLLNNNSKQPIDTRISGPATHELRSEKFMKIISLAPGVL